MGLVGLFAPLSRTWIPGALRFVWVIAALGNSLSHDSLTWVFRTVELESRIQDCGDGLL